MINKCKVCDREYDKKWSLFKNSKYYPSVCSTKCFLKMLSKRKPYSLTDMDISIYPKLSSIVYTTGNLHVVPFKSKYEKKVGEVLAENKILFMYEPYAINITSYVYVPDFFIPQSATFLEVKGLWEGNAYQKFKGFHKQFSNKFNIYLLDRDFLRQIGVRV